MTIAITNVALTGNVVTITTSAAHGIPATFNGNPTVVAIEGLTNSALNGVWSLAAVPSSTTFTFALTHGDISSTPDSGTAIQYSGQGLRVSQLTNATAVPVAGRFLVDDPAKAGSEGVSLSLLGSLIAASSSFLTALLGTVNGWTAQQYFVEQTLTDAATITWNANTQQAAKVTLGGNRTLALPTNLKAGSSYSLRIIQDATGSRTLAFAGGYKFAGGSAPTISTAANAIDIISFLSDGTNMFGGAILKGMA